MEGTLAEIRGLRKAFDETQALDGVSLAVERGEVHALLGENGAGKSTLVKILSGVLQADAGEVLVDGDVLTGASSRARRAAGISTAFQELSLLPNLTVAENLLLPELPRGRFGLLSRRVLRRRAGHVLARWGIEVSPDAPVESLPLATKQRLEIVKALSHEPKLLILDEPTAALADPEWLFEHIASVTARGASVLYISHRLPEIRRICNRGTVLRNGRVVGSFAGDDFDEDRLISLMIGRSFEATFIRRANRAAEESVLDVRGLKVGTGLQGVDLTVRRGEIVGVAALEGQGQHELFYAMYGLAAPTAGAIEVDGKPIRIRSPRRALSAMSGIALVPEERKTEALFLELSARRNLTVPILSAVSAAGFVLPWRERARAAKEARALNIAPDALDRPVGRLSGGNQQKVVLGKTLLTGARCLLLFDPTRGIDAATKLEIYDLVRGLADRGTSVLMYSTEIPELVGLCDRVYTIYGGRINGEFAGDRLNEHNLLSAAVGHVRNGGARGVVTGEAAGTGGRA